MLILRARVSPALAMDFFLALVIVGLVVAVRHASLHRGKQIVMLAIQMENALHQYSWQHF